MKGAVYFLSLERKDDSMAFFTSSRWVAESPSTISLILRKASSGSKGFFHFAHLLLWRLPYLLYFVNIKSAQNYTNYNGGKQYLQEKGICLLMLVSRVRQRKQIAVIFTAIMSNYRKFSPAFSNLEQGEQMRYLRVSPS